MRIGQFVEYKGCVGTIEYDPEDELYYGKLLDIDDFVNYHGDDIFDLEKQFHDAVDDYIELCSDIGKEPESKPVKLTEEEFYRKHCQLCGSQRCEGIGKVDKNSLDDNCPLKVIYENNK